MCNNNDIISSIDTEIKHIKNHQEKDRDTLEELRRALYGHNGEPGLIGKVSAIAGKVSDMENTFKDVKRGIWAVVFILVALFLTDLYGVVMSTASRAQP